MITFSQEDQASGNAPASELVMTIAIPYIQMFGTDNPIITNISTT